MLLGYLEEGAGIFHIYGRRKGGLLHRCDDYPVSDRDAVRDRNVPRVRRDGLAVRDLRSGYQLDRMPIRDPAAGHHEILLRRRVRGHAC